MITIIKMLIMRVALITLGIVVGSYALHADERPISVPLDILLLNLDSPTEPEFGQTLTADPGYKFQFSLSLSDSPILPPISTLSMSFQEPSALIGATFSPNLPSGWSSTFLGDTLSLENLGGADDENLGGMLGTLTVVIDPEAIAGTYFFLPGISNVDAEDSTGNPLDAGQGLSPAIRVEVVPEPEGFGLYLLGLVTLTSMVYAGRLRSTY